MLALAAAMLLAIGDTADARAGRGGGFGSRGARTFTPPAATQTAPAPNTINRTMATPTQPGMAQRVPAATQGSSWFSRNGLMGGLLGGLVGAGLFGMLFGHGLFGGLGGFASMLGLLLQIALVVIVARLAWRWWQNRNAGTPAYAGNAPQPDAPVARSALGAGFGLGGGAATARGGQEAYSATRPVSGPVDEIGIGQADLDLFEKLLGEVQTAYGAEDLGALRQKATPEMASYFAEELADNASRGTINRISDVRLLNGDIAESWREGEVDYATVAMHFSMLDVVEERATGRVVEGDRTHPVEVTEIWTFRRARDGNWMLSAIQQA